MAQLNIDLSMKVNAELKAFYEAEILKREKEITRLVKSNAKYIIENAEMKIILDKLG